MATKTKKKMRPSEQWKKSDRFPVIFWVAGKLKAGLISASKRAKVSRAELFRQWAGNGFPVKRGGKLIKKPKAKPAKAVNSAPEVVATA